MPSEKKKADPVQPPSEPPVTKPSEDTLRLSTLLKQEGIPEIEAKGFLVGSRLAPTDRMTVTAFRKRFSGWRNQPAGKESR